MITRPELAELVQAVRAVARAEIMPRFRRLDPADVHVKTGPLDLVTAADEAAEAALTGFLRTRYPDAAIIGEEAAERDPASLAAIATAGLAFIIDPVDGTANYAAGLPLFATILAVTASGETVAGVIHDPVGDDTAIALKGEGAWLETADGTARPLRVADPAPLAHMAGGLSWRFIPEPLRSAVCARLPRVAAAWDYRCGAHQYRLLAAGHCHFGVWHRLLPWDHAAGVLLHKEAGGYAARLDGTPYRPAESTGGLICAPDRPSWDALRKALFAPVDPATPEKLSPASL